MKKLRRLTALLMVLVMMVSVTGCGKKDKKEDKEEETVKVSEIRELKDILAISKKYDTGRYSLKLSASADFADSEYGELVEGPVSVSFNAEGKREKTKFTVDKLSDGLEYIFKGEKYKFGGSVDDALTYDGERLYVNLDELLSGILKVNTNMGVLSLLMPEYDEDRINEFIEKNSDILFSILNEALGEFEVEGQDNKYVIKLTKAKQVKRAADAAVNYIADNKESVSEMLRALVSLADINYDKYIENFIDENEDGIIALYELFGKEFDSKALDKKEDELKNAFDGKADYFFDQAKDKDSKFFEELIDSFESEYKNHYSSVFDSKDYEQNMDNTVLLNPELTIKAEDDSYSVKLVLDGEIENLQITAKIEFEFIPEKVSVKAPEGTKSLKEIADYISEHKDLFTERILDFAVAFRDIPDTGNVFGAFEDQVGFGSIILAGIVIPFVAGAREINPDRGGNDVTVTPTPAPVDSSLIKIGIINNDPNESGYRTANATDLKNMFTKENGYDSTFFYCNKNNDQIEAALKCIQDGVDYLAICAGDTDGWDSVLIAARDAGVKVILFDRVLNADESMYESAIVSDLYTEGKKAAEWLEEQKLDEYNIIHLQGIIGSNAQKGRTDGLMEAADKNGWNIVKQSSAEWSPELAQQIVEEVIDSGRKFNVIYAENDDMAKGAVAALDKAGITHGPDSDVVIMGFDADKWALEELYYQRWNYDGQCSPFQAAYIDTVIRMLENGEDDIPKTYYIEEIGFDAATITQEDIELYGI